MDRLKELRKSILSMTPDEQREYIRKIRQDRRITKERPAKKVARKVQGNRAKTALMKMLDDMPAEQREAILRELGNASQDSGSGPNQS